ncbi:membrane-bound PQQ-dependent dehydrogenase, glucose/quinate/shikimate family [Comamonas sp.]|uniref:membrane-bound PQQ-dependent dehydrogenase, glucose/quinate/shikimate family n=1 Tax=Comamonas sp. TaxID=34028 RepID=UPI00289B10A4|nr:membrane-bound PQQ-dependent dehydrogenase, glucose/quinate/shikimate family [Comamonas sp.]
MSASQPARAPRAARVFAAILGVIAIALGAYLAYGGLQLLQLGGSFYYLPVGLLVLVAGVFLVRADVRGAWLYAACLAITVVWALWEAGWHFWPLAARIGLPAVLGMLIALVVPYLRGSERCAHIKGASRGTAALLALGIVGAFIAAFQPIWTVKPGAEPEIAQGYQPGDDHANWTNYGRTPDGTQFATADQITPGNVKGLQVAWTFRTGDFAFGGKENQNTPLQIGNVLYACTPSNQVFAIEADTGKQLWTFDPKVNSGFSPTWQRCRSLAYYELPQTAESAPAPKTPAASAPVTPPSGACARRIYLTTADMRLIALDAANGQFCSGFGKNGQVSLATGMGDIVPGFYNPTAGPVLAGDRLLVGGWVMDNQSVDEPSGAVRAFDAVTGDLAWAWDVGRPGVTTAPGPGEHYTRGTPNTWAAPTYDAELGLVYLPTGNGTPDMYGGHRTPETDRVSSSVVALDARTGAERWVFQTTHHDVWDYDLPSKPVLYDVPGDNGQRIPALIQTTKRGEIFVIDRRSGKPIAEVQEKPVSTEGLPGEKLAATQPYSVGMPQIRQGVLTEAQMWGITPIDQLACRIAFKQLEYKGDFTPPSTNWYIPHPSPFGTMNWGGISIDKVHDYLIVNDMRIMMKARLLPRAEADKAIIASGKTTPSVAGVVPMEGTPYGVNRVMVTSQIGVPCTDPPFGMMTAIDLKTRKIAWQRSLGTVEQMGPMGIKTGLPIPIGMPSLGGPVATASGLIFYTGTADYYLRAMDVKTGEEIWKSPLPVGAQSTPLVFKSPSSGKQYVVVTAGGGRTAPDRGDYIIAYALPDAK